LVESVRLPAVREIGLAPPLVSVEVSGALVAPTAVDGNVIVVGAIDMVAVEATPDRFQLTSTSPK
jgi:hypothetical protein